jgi:uncharacterized protein (DUF488 family)
MTILTIGFTQKSAERFFTLLKNAKVETLVDVRLNNVSQLAGFAKRDDLRFFVREICGAKYIHETVLAPEPAMLKAYQTDAMSWDDYEKRFLDLMAKRRIEARFSATDLEKACLLCSEHTPHQCHRRLVAEYLSGQWARPVEVIHLT